ncbi:MAG: DUF4921 family protein [Micrococcales bacterium]|nr:DUF4921 family protein [Micrococcales bacterium]
MHPSEHEFLVELPDGTLKQLNPFTGTQVWTVPSRGNRPLPKASEAASPDPNKSEGEYCHFCERKYAATPPEKARVIRDEDGQWRTEYLISAEDRDTSHAEFRRIPNLFEILAYDYWQANYGYTMPKAAQEHAEAYLASPAGQTHLLGVAREKLKRSGWSESRLNALSVDDPDFQRTVQGFFGSGHDLIVARKHFTTDAKGATVLAASGTMTPQEHGEYIDFTVKSAKDLLDVNPDVQYVVVFQNWLADAGASLDHLHKQLVAIDEHGTQHERECRRLQDNPNVFNAWAANYAIEHNLVIAENDHALAFAGFGHRFPTIEVFSKSEACEPWDHSEAELRGMSDLLHAMHAATEPNTACNEEWHYRPRDCTRPMPWRIMLKWRLSKLAGFEGATKIYTTTISPFALRDQVVRSLQALREADRIADLHIGDSCVTDPNPLRYYAPKAMRP